MNIYYEYIHKTKTVVSIILVIFLKSTQLEPKNNFLSTNNKQQNTCIPETAVEAEERGEGLTQSYGLCFGIVHSMYCPILEPTATTQCSQRCTVKKWHLQPYCKPACKTMFLF